jgi:Flp pilus assembly protein TadB
MKTPSLFKDEAELKSIREQHKLLLQAEKDLAEKLEQDRTMPPLDGLDERERLKRYEHDLATRKQHRNVMKAQRKSFLLLVMLVLCTAALIAWSWRLLMG